ncbi:MAG: DNA polymerase III subunit chi [Aliidongia sp.]
MVEIGFYHLTRSTLDQALPRLLERAFGAGHRILLKAPDVIETERLNRLLWTYGEGSFLPHGSAVDGRAEEQPIYLTCEDDNPNGATLGCQCGGAELAVVERFGRVLDLFEGSDEQAVAAARERWRRYTAAGHTLVYWQQNPNGGWAERKA